MHVVIQCVSASFAEKTIIFLLNDLGTLVKNQLSLEKKIDIFIFMDFEFYSTDL